MLLELLIVFLLHEKSGADINPLDKTYKGEVDKDVSIPWIYDYESDLFNVEWSFKNSSSTIVILTKFSTNPAQVQNSFNVQHDGNGKITLKKVTRENDGIYYCKVVYTVASAKATVTGTATLSIYECICGFSEGLNGADIASIILSSMCIVAVIILIILQPCLPWEPPQWLKIVVTILVIAIAIYALIIGPITVAWNDDCRNCTSTCDIPKCNSLKKMGIANIVLFFIDAAVLIVFLVQGWCGERFSCLNRVLPVCKDTEQRGPPDGKPDSHAAKEKRREVTHNEQHNLKETGVHKDKPNKEKHEEPSKGRPLPQPTGSNRDDTGSAGAVSRQDVVLDRRPMPDIPSDRHKRGLSANFHDDRDTPLDDNILHTLPVVKKPKNALDPMNTEGQSKNGDDQPKKKKKKKDRDTSRSDEIEDNIDSHGKVLAF